MIKIISNLADFEWLPQNADDSFFPKLRGPALFPKM
jgi:hypothetical protein